MTAEPPRTSKRSGGGPRTVIAWLIHFEEPAAIAAFNRLQREGSDYGDVVCVCHGDAPLVGLETTPLRLPDAEVRSATLPDVIGRGAPHAQLAAIRRLPGYDRYWFIEYDVDFSGCWSRFFTEFEGCEADLVGTTLYPRSLNPGWLFWRSFAAPAEVPQDLHTRGFFPVVRLSSRFVDVYLSEVLRGWRGHYEALYPTLALAKRLSIEDVGGRGPFAPPERRGRLYTNTVNDPMLCPGSFRFRPPVSDAYYTRGSPNYPEPEMLWHPVKTSFALSLSWQPQRRLGARPAS